MNVKFSKDIQEAFIAGPDGLKKLGSLFSDRIGPLEIQIDCVDEITRNFASMKELLLNENAKSKAIKRLRLFARSKEFDKRAEIKFTDSEWRGISIELDASEEVVSRLKDEVLDILSGMRPWYAPVHRFEPTKVFILALFFLLAALLFSLYNLGEEVLGPQKFTPRSLATYVSIVLAMPFLSLFALSLIVRGKNSVFPRAIFGIGQGAGRLINLERIQGASLLDFLFPRWAAFLSCTGNYGCTDAPAHLPRTCNRQVEPLFSASAVNVRDSVD